MAKRKLLQRYPFGATLAMAALFLVLMLPVMGAPPSTVTFTTIDIPGATYSEVDGINAQGQMVGVYADATGKLHGFYLDKGAFTNIDFPGATTFTEPIGINSRGQISGIYDSGGTQHGFLLDNGTFSTIDPPGSTFTQAAGISDSGQVVGRYLNGSGSFHGFVLDHGSYTTFDVPGATRTDATGINSAGEITGDYVDSLGELSRLSAESGRIQRPERPRSRGYSGIRNRFTRPDRRLLLRCCGHTSRFLARQGWIQHD